MELLGNVRYHINISDILHRIMAMYKKKEVGSYMLCIGDAHVTIHAYILDVHIIIVFHVFSCFLDRKVIRSGIRKS